MTARVREKSCGFAKPKKNKSREGARKTDGRVSFVSISLDEQSPRRKEGKTHLKKEPNISSSNSIPLHERFELSVTHEVDQVAVELEFLGREVVE